MLVSNGHRTMMQRVIRIVLLLFLASTCISCSGSFTPTPAPVEKTDHFIAYGNPRVTVVFYVDLESFESRSFAATTYQEVKKKYIFTGQIKWVVRHFPQSENKNAKLAARAAECAAQKKKLFEYMDKVLEDKHELTKAKLVRMARELEIEPEDSNEFETCIDDIETLKALARDLQLAQDAKIPKAPSFVIGDKGVYPNGLISAIEEALK